MNNDILRSVSITGLGGDAFQQCLASVVLWDLRMSRQFDQTQWKYWSAAPGNGHGATVQFSNRAVTPSFLCDGEEGDKPPEHYGTHIQKLVNDGGFKYIQVNRIDMYEHIKTEKSNR